ncbi:hypothetical protein Wcon_01289 [Wolbachia endosymbiont of Cylisticus convexus]|uniref:hypothetical protein n=1 Tax=Wolbachia endosymbiont of Cylisticus convexus TaxID=118728 RepID=UPI000E14429C|nr:hypothetical protein [Wolbachia endosymbiont of Cylisticus convexus]RDD34607.1 hypothetical protein Wcon_01289 [Wolbachia endosymbiont of Cylisticus convexus]
MSILSRLFGVNTTILKVKEVTDFSITNIAFIEENEIAYGLSYQDNGNGSSRVKLLISPLYQSKTYECDTCVNVANEFKGQLSPTLIEDSAEVDKVGVIFPTEEINKEEKCIKGLTFNTYEIKHSINVPLVEYVGKVKLYKNINRDSLANEDNSYFQPKAVKVGNGNVIVIAHNLKDQTLVSWYLQSDTNGKFKVLREKNGLIERKLFKFNNPGQLALDENTILYSQVRKNSIENPEVRKTNIFKFDMAKVVEDLKSGKKDECLLGKKNCQINTASSITSNPGEINFLQYVRRTVGDDLVAFLAEDRLPNKQTLHLTSLVKNGSKSNFIIHEFKDSVDQLYVKDNGQEGFIVTAVSGESIITFNRESSGKSSKATIIPTSSIKTLSDFVNIINGRLTPSIISSSTVALITATKTVMTSKGASTTAITGTTRTDALKTTKLITEAVAPTSTISKPSTESTTQASTVTVEPTTVASTTAAPTSTTSKPSTESTIQTSIVTVEPTTVAKTTTTPQTTTVATTSTSVPIVTSRTETSTAKSTAATIASTSKARSTTMSKPLTELTTETGTTSTSSEPTTIAETIATSQSAMITTMPTNVPTTNSEKTIQTLSIMPSTRTKATTPLLTTTLFSQSTASPQLTQLAIGSDRAGMIGGSLVGAIGIAGIIGFIAYKYVKSRNAAPVLELTNFNDRRLSSSSGNSDEEIFIASNGMSHISMQTMYQSEIVLNSISIESSSRSRSSSSSLSGGPGSRLTELESKSEKSLSWDSDDVPEYHL